MIISYDSLFLQGTMHFDFVISQNASSFFRFLRRTYSSDRWKTIKVTFMVQNGNKPRIAKSVYNPYIPLTSSEMGIDPVSLRIILRKLEDRYHLPLIITENGVGWKMY